MNFLEGVHNFHKTINKWLGKNMGKFFLVFFLILLVSIHFRVTIYLVFLISIIGIAMLFIMICDVIYLIRSGYQPPRCDKCGHILPDKDE